MKKTELPNILIVDDLQENRLALEALLSSLPANLLSADSAASALDILLRHEIALVLLDVQMPEVNGFELAEIMRGVERTKSVPIVFVTAGAPDSSWEFRGYDAGAVDFLFKPLDSRIVLSKVKVLLSIFRHKADLEAQIRLSEAARARAERLAEKLETETKLRDRFVAALSHDLRVPLSAARLAAQMLERQKALDTPAIARYANKVIGSIDRADRMIMDLLDVSRLEAGKPIPIQLHEVNVDHLFQRLRDDLVLMFGNRLQFEVNAGITAWWNDDAIRRVLENLVSNAAKYGSTDLPITVRVSSTNGRSEIQVHNFGNPIPEAEQKKLFQRFHRTGEAEQSGKVGWGIGLAICRGIVSALRGELRVQSNERSGTTFFIELPIDPRPSGEVAEAPSA